MAQLNVKQQMQAKHTHEGARAAHITHEQQLRRSVMACMLWEDEFYEDGVSIAQRIAATVPLVDATTVMEIAIEARTNMKLRHVPLLIARQMCRLPEHKKLVAHTLEQIIQRPDELTEFLAIYWATNSGKKSLPAQVKKGLSAAFSKFNEYSLAKYNRDGAVKLRDALFLSHAKPNDTPGRYTRRERELERNKLAKRKVPLSKGEDLYRKVVDGTLEIPDTWETELSAGKDKKETFTRLITEGKLGALALLRNLRNMRDAGVDKEIIKMALEKMSSERVLPYRFIAAARAVPEYEDMIEPAMLACMEGQEKFAGRTVLLVDVSGSMDALIGGKSDMRRVDAACGLAILIREVCEDVAVATFSDSLVQVAPRRGFALRDAIVGSQQHSGTDLGGALRRVENYDRLIVITDEQSHTSVPPPSGLGYVINVASAEHGVGYGSWIHIDGWSEAVVDYIRMWEDEDERRVA